MDLFGIRAIQKRRIFGWNCHFFIGILYCRHHWPFQIIEHRNAQSEQFFYKHRGQYFWISHKFRWKYQLLAQKHRISRNDHFAILFSFYLALFSPLIRICSGLLFIYYAIFFHSLPSTNTRTGPCGGKTTGQSRMCTFFENLGWKVSINKCSIISRVRFSRLDYFVCFLYCTRVFYSRQFIHSIDFVVTFICIRNLIESFYDNYISLRWCWW